jgi:hypothetical protein
MRRFFVLLPSIALVAVAGLGASTAHARARPSMIPCPLVAAAPGPPCCGPPIASRPAETAVDCCPLRASGNVPPICCVGASPCSVTISASPDPADGAQRITVSGTVFGGAPAGMAVQLWQQVAGDASFSKAASTTVGSDGTYSFTAPGTVNTNRQWYVTVGALQSATLAEPVSAAVTLQVRTGRRSATVHGAVAPSHSGETVLLQRKLGRKWVTIARPVLSHDSRFSVRYGGGRRVKETLRAVLPADAKNMRSFSSTVNAMLPRHARAA